MADPESNNTNVFKKKEVKQKHEFTKQFNQINHKYKK